MARSEDRDSPLSLKITQSAGLLLVFLCLAVFALTDRGEPVAIVFVAGMIALGGQNAQRALVEIRRFMRRMQDDPEP